MQMRTLREVAADVDDPLFGADVDGAVRRAVTGYGQNDHGNRLKLLHELDGGGRVTVETDGDDRQDGHDRDPWRRFLARATATWSLARHDLAKGSSLTVRTGDVEVPLDGRTVPLFFFGDDDVWVVGGLVLDRWVSVLGRGVPVAALRLVTLGGVDRLGGYEFADGR